MRASEFMTAEEGIAFLKFMIDKTWFTIKTEAEKKTEREENIRKTKKAKPKHKKAKPKKHTVRPPKRKPSKPSTTKKMTKKKPPFKRKPAPRAGLDAKKPLPPKKPLKPIPVSVLAGRPLRDKDIDTAYLDN